jgi:uncharacterized lipoprotein YddW (UPF0748 family)
VVHVEEKMVHQSLKAILWRLTAAAALVTFAASCADTSVKPGAAEVVDATLTPPPIPREFRAAWVATVANIDWPSKRDLTTAQQQAEIVSILDRAKSLNMNAIVLQVRTTADALYASPIEPWSEFLTGTQGKAPEPFYDPLEMWVKEAHQRGIELHAWFNPYRARHTQSRTPNAANHIANTKPHAVKAYGGFLWMDPGEVDASQQTLNVILDVVRRYDIDGVHIDDYFYPYPVPVPGTEAPAPSPDDTPQPRAELPFPDDPSWQRYVASSGKLARADWRRQNVNDLVEKIYAGIKREKPHVKFGISPFGLGKPDRRPPGIAGFSQYDKLYADAELWLNRGWLDYFTPQLYWPIDQAPQAYGVLLDYWHAENTMQRHLWPGIYTTRIQPAGATMKSWEPQEIVNQITLTRSRTPTQPMTTGHVHFSMVGLTQNRRGVSDELKKIYAGAALVPASPWLAYGKKPSLDKVQLSISRDKMRPNKIMLVTQVGNFDRRFAHTAVQWKTDGKWDTMLTAMGGDVSMKEVMLDELAGLPDVVVITFVDRFGQQSPPLRVTRQQLQDAKVSP